jgi:hypothetical protein
MLSRHSDGPRITQALLCHFVEVKQRLKRGRGLSFTQLVHDAILGNRIHLQIENLSGRQVAFISAEPLRRPRNSARSQGLA